MKHKIIVAVLMGISLMLGGCFGEDDADGEAVVDGKNIFYDNGEFVILVPRDWEVIEQTDFTSNVPGETVLAIRNNILSEIFTTNVNISKTIIKENILAEDFAKSSITKAKKHLLEFADQGLEATNVPVGSGEALEAFILNFEGKKGASDPEVRFRQLVTIYQGVGYTVTAAYLPTEDESVVKATDEMLNSFSLK